MSNMIRAYKLQPGDIFTIQTKDLDIEQMNQLHKMVECSLPEYVKLMLLPSEFISEITVFHQEEDKEVPLPFK